MSPIQKEIVSEIYRALVLLGADNGLLGAVGSWGDSLPEADVLADLRAWNEATQSEIKDRIGHYEKSSPHLVTFVIDSSRYSRQP